MGIDYDELNKELNKSYDEKIANLISKVEKATEASYERDEKFYCHCIEKLSHFLSEDNRILLFVDAFDALKKKCPEDKLKEANPYFYSALGIKYESMLKKLR